jgi:light-regulated signal transduction histidine kinase (bacteriophytochrome)
MTALHNDQNEIIGFSKVTRDLTERKLTEERMKEYAARLEFQNKELEQFAYAASHDLKEPLRKIHLYNSSVLNNNRQILDEKSKEYLNRSMTAVKRMFTLIEELLNYSRTTVGTSEFEHVDLNEVITAIEQMNKEAIEENKISIEKDDLPTIKGIPFQVNQLMENLITNAIKYKHPLRNVQIQIKSKIVKGSELAGVPAEANRKYQMISVIDNGVGFKPEYAEKIFNIFQRLNNHPNAKGSGIGLAICKRIVQNHHGFIKAAGSENEGARFDIFFPA